MPAPHHTSSRGDRSLIAIVVVPLILALTLLTFAWPAARLAPRHLPIGVAGPETAATPLERQLAESGGAFDRPPLRRRLSGTRGDPGPRGLRRGRGRPAGRHRPDRLGRQPLRRGDARARVRGAREPRGSPGGRRGAGRPAGSARDRLRLAGAAAGARQHRDGRADLAPRRCRAASDRRAPRRGGGRRSRRSSAWCRAGSASSRATGGSTPACSP